LAKFPISLETVHGELKSGVKFLTGSRFLAVSVQQNNGQRWSRM